MYLAGFFASPLPYLLLGCFYLSGFACYKWWGADHSEPIPREEKSPSFAISQELSPVNTYFVPLPPEDLQGPDALPSIPAAMAPPDEMPGQTGPYQPPSRQHPFLTHHRIRPPPMA